MAHFKSAATTDAPRSTWRLKLNLPGDGSPQPDPGEPRNVGRDLRDRQVQLAQALGTDMVDVAADFRGRYIMLRSCSSALIRKVQEKRRSSKDSRSDALAVPSHDGTAGSGRRTKALRRPPVGLVGLPPGRRTTMGSERAAHLYRRAAFGSTGRSSSEAVAAGPSGHDRSAARGTGQCDGVQPALRSVRGGGGPRRVDRSTARAGGCAG